MSDDHADHEHHSHESSEERTTAPQSDYTSRDVAIGFVVTLVGMAVVFGVPLLLG